VDDTPFDFDPVRHAAWSVIAVVTVMLLVLGKALLVPLAIAIFIWILLGAIKSLLVSLAPSGTHVPAWLANVVGILVIVASAYAAIAVIMGQSAALTADDGELAEPARSYGDSVLGRRFGYRIDVRCDAHRNLCRVFTCRRAHSAGEDPAFA
jgi:hypothetical protein